jgi:hypothetical protein
MPGMLATLGKLGRLEMPPDLEITGNHWTPRDIWKAEKAWNK